MTITDNGTPSGEEIVRQILKDEREIQEREEAPRIERLTTIFAEWKNLPISTKVKHTASHPDNKERYQEKQDRWSFFSTQIIDYTKNRIEENPDIKFRDLYLDLAILRGFIAKKLRHGASEEDSRTDEYGLLRRPRTHPIPSETFKKYDSNRSWPKQTGAVFKKFDLLQENSDASKIFIPQRRKEKNVITYPNQHIPKEEQTHVSLTFLSTISYDLPEGSDKPEVIKVYYATLENQEVVDKHWETLDKYFQSILKSKDDEEIKTNIGKMMHLLGNFLPCYLGSAAIGEWMLKTIVDVKGYKIEFNFKKGGNIGWDFNALITPDIDQYAEWFSKSAVKFTKLEKQKEDTPNPDPSPFKNRILSLFCLGSRN